MRDSPNRLDTDSPPLCVDLDGTLTTSDTLIESVFILIKQSPLSIINLLIWLFRGKAYLKRQVALRTDIDYELVPWSHDFVEFLREQHRNGRKLALVTASDQKVADAVAAHLGIFEQAVGSDGSSNLNGKQKLEKLRVLHPEGKFDYAGNSGADLKIFPYAVNAYLVNTYSWIAKKARKNSKIEREFSPGVRSICAIQKSFRVYQWPKNLLLFLPLLFNHRINELPLLFQAAIAFLSFSLCASAVYLLNDCFDLENDRKHPIKRNRPFASGILRLDLVVLLVPILLLISIALALTLPSEFLVILCIYFSICFAYSAWIKHGLIVDVLVLSSCYVIRLLAGGAAIGIVVSDWLLGFSVFFFLSLGLLKRYLDLRNAREVAHSNFSSQYSSGDYRLIHRFGVAIGLFSVVVLAFYIYSDQAMMHYGAPHLLWLLCPILLFWMFRMWTFAQQNRIGADLIIFVFRDQLNYLLSVASLIVLWAAA